MLRLKYFTIFVAVVFLNREISALPSFAVGTHEEQTNTSSEETTSESKVRNVIREEECSKNCTFEELDRDRTLEPYRKPVATLAGILRGEDFESYDGWKKEGKIASNNSTLWGESSDKNDTLTLLNREISALPSIAVGTHEEQTNTSSEETTPESKVRKVIRGEECSKNCTFQELNRDRTLEPYQKPVATLAGILSREDFESYGGWKKERKIASNNPTLWGEASDKNDTLIPFYMG